MATKSNHPENLPYEDQVLRRMLSSPPKPHKEKAAPAKKVAKKAAK